MLLWHSAAADSTHQTLGQVTLFCRQFFCVLRRLVHRKLSSHFLHDFILQFHFLQVFSLYLFPQGIQLIQSQSFILWKKKIIKINHLMMKPQHFHTITCTKPFLWLLTFTSKQYIYNGYKISSGLASRRNKFFGYSQWQRGWVPARSRVTSWCKWHTQPLERHAWPGTGSAAS